MSGGGALSRGELVRLGRSGRPWAFLGAVRAALHETPDDPGLRFLTADAFAALGLRGLASAQLGLLTGAAAEAGPAVALRERLLGMADDRVALAERVAAAEGAAGVLESRGFAVRGELERWVEAEAGVEQCRAVDGNVVRFASGTTDLAVVEPLEDARAVALDLAERLSPLEAEHAAPVTIEGLSNPFIAFAILGGAVRHKGGFHRRVRIVEPSVERVFAAAAVSPGLVGLLGEERVELFVGDGAGETLSAALEARSSFIIAGPVVGTATGADAAGRVEAAGRRQSAELAGVRARVMERDRGRDAAWWARRYEQAMSGDGAALRVLIPTCRFSTYIQHSSRMLAEAFRRAGHEAEVLIEPDDSTNLGNISYLAACERVDPDLIVLVNYPRAERAEAFPAGVPFVCWMQDHMPHLYRRELGRAQGERDFLMGHMGYELFERYGYRADRALASPVVVDTGVFHDGPVDGALLEEHACEIAYVSHQSEPYGAMVERLCAEAKEPSVVAVIREVAELVKVRVDRLAGEPIAPLLRRGVLEAVERVRVERDQELTSQIFHHAAMPMAERLVRHRTLEWAAELSERRGWRLRVYGRGWEGHPTLSRYAAGELEHGEALRASYAAAAVHLHPTVRAMSHQRVMECALSGGFPLCTYYAGATPGDDEVAAMLRLDPELGRPGPREGTLEFVRAEHAGLMVDAARRQRLGLAVSGTIVVDEARLRRHLSLPLPEGNGMAEPTRLFPELSVFSFMDRAGFEARVERAIEDRAWRARWSGALAARVRGEFTQDALVERLVGFVGRRLAEGAGARQSAVAAA